MWYKIKPLLKEYEYMVKTEYIEVALIFSHSTIVKMCYTQINLKDTKCFSLSASNLPFNE